MVLGAVTTYNGYTLLAPAKAEGKTSFSMRRGLLARLVIFLSFFGTGTATVWADQAPLPGVQPVSHQARIVGGPRRQRDFDGELAALIDELLAIALVNIHDSSDLDRAVEKYSSNMQKGRSNAKDVAINYIGLPRGFDYSEEGARLSLDQEHDVRSLEAAQCARQQKIDKVHEEIIVAVLQIAAGFGEKNPAVAQQNIVGALGALEHLCGPRDAARMLELVSSFCKSRIDEKRIAQAPITLAQLREQTALAGQLAMQQDFTMIGIKEKLNGYKDHTKAKQIGGKVVEGTVSVMTIFGPGIGVPIAAQAAGAAWGLANGGSEESKLLKELYYQKELDSRRRVLESEAQLAILSRDQAIHTHNTPLLICSESVLAQLVGAIGIQQLISHPALDHGIFVSQTIAGPGSKASSTYSLQRTGQ
jgi:hypothetical protein